MRKGSQSVVGGKQRTAARGRFRFRVFRRIAFVHKLLAILQDASQELHSTAMPEQLETLQANASAAAEITDEFWHTKRFLEQEVVYVLQVVAVESRLKGTGAFRRLVDPVISACKANSVPLVLQTHNPANVPPYEHFGFTVEEEAVHPKLGLHCYSMALTPSAATA